MKGGKRGREEVERESGVKRDVIAVDVVPTQDFTSTCSHTFSLNTKALSEASKTE